MNAHRITLESVADIPAVVGAVLTFTPADSLVLIGLKGGPTARVDLHPLVDGVTSLRQALSHWSNGVILACYSDDETTLPAAQSAMAATIPELEVKVAVRVDTAGGVWVDGVRLPARPSSDPEVAATCVAPSRQALVDDADTVATTKEALAMAWEAWRAGQGARAWCYLDRFVALGGPLVEALELNALLRGAVDPATRDE